jgi:hypothetical protein
LSVYAAYLCFLLCDLALSRLARPALQVCAATLAGGLAAWSSAHGLAAYPLAALVAGSCTGLGVLSGVLLWLDQRDASGYRHELTRSLQALRKR